jgi:replicative DNA helicase
MATKKNNLGLPPQNIDAEKSFIGSVLIDNKSLMRVMDAIGADDFYDRNHQIIYEAIAHLNERGQNIDVLTLSDKLSEMGEIDNVGGAGYLASLVNSVGTSAHIKNYADIIRKKKVLRDMISASHEILELSNNEDEDIENLLDTAEQKLFAISQKSQPQNFIAVPGLLQEAFERLDKLHKGDGTLRGLSTGFMDLDEILAGLQNSDLLILAARPSLGKTALALDLALNVARKTGVNVGICSLEMSKASVIDRLLASEAGVSLWKLRTGKLSTSGEHNDFEKISAALGTISGYNIYIDDAPSPTIMQIRAMARRLQAAHGLDVLFVDYLQLIKPQRSYGSPVQEITEISRSLKSLARELDIPVVALSQLSRAVETRSDQRPKLSDLRDSGSIEQDADVVMFIYREDVVKGERSNKPNIAEIIIAKQRNGPTGQIDLFFDREKTSFKNLAKTMDVPDVF